MWRTPQCTAQRFALLVAGLVILATTAAGCGPASIPPSAAATASAAQSTPNLVYVIDGNYVAATSVYDLHSSVVALDPRDGHTVWRHALDASSPADPTTAPSPPLYHDGVVYVSYYYEHQIDPQNLVRHGVVAALDATTGAERWRREVGAELAGEPVVDGSTLYVSATVELSQAQSHLPPPITGVVEALDIHTGSVRWSRTLPTTPSMAAAADGRVFVIARQQFAGDLLALAAGDGSVAWDYASDVPLTRGGDAQNGRSDAPQVVAGRVYVEAVERDTRGGAQLKLLALDAGNGHVAWQHQTTGGAATPAFNQSGDTVCLSVPDTLSDTSIIVGLSASNGATRWTITGTAGFVSGCTAAGDTFYVTQGALRGTAGSVLALNGQNGHQIWKTQTAVPGDADGLLAPAVSADVVGVYLVGPPPGSGPLQSTMAVLRASDGKLLWQRNYEGRPDFVLDIEGSLIVNAEFSDNFPIVAVYAVDTGALLWTYAIGHL